MKICETVRWLKITRYVITGLVEEHNLFFSLSLFNQCADDIYLQEQIKADSENDPPGCDEMKLTMT